MLSSVVWRPGVQRLRANAIAAVLALLFTMLLSPSNATATSSGSGLTLEDLVEDNLTMDSKNGNLRFSNFAVEISGGSDDLSVYRVSDRFDGFKIFGPETETQEDFLNIRLSYDVEDIREETAMVSVGLSSNRWNPEQTNSAFIEVFDEYGESLVSDLVELTTSDFGADDAYFSEYSVHVSVFEDIKIDKSENAEKWNLNRRFRSKKKIPMDPVPEPNTALLVSMGIVGLAAVGRRRGKRAGPGA